MATLSATDNGTIPSRQISITGTNVDANTYNFDYDYNWFGGNRGFSIITGTLTDCTVTVHVSNDGTNFVDATSTLFGVASLASSTPYGDDLPTVFRIVRIKVVTPDATNAVDLQIFFPRR